MPDSEIHDLSSETTEIVACPVFIVGNDGPENCGMPLRVMVTKTIRGDDYGDWPEFSVYFKCGHDFNEMMGSLKIAEFI